MTDTVRSKIPLHKWTHAGDRVLLVKCVAKGGLGYGNFAWPKSGPVSCPRAAADRDGAARVTGNGKADCESGGLFGWAWAVNLGGGKEPDYRGDWIVFAARPEDVIELGDKHKSVGPCDVVYYGDALGALIFTLPGRIAWVEHNSEGSASATGERGSASATGGSGSASATGWRGSASATGVRGSASATGVRGSASATGESGSASATGESGSASATGESGNASATGGRGSASATGVRGSASATGESGSASATGWSGSASATGERGSASATGESGVAALTGEYGTIEVGANGLGAVTAESWNWRVRKGAVVAWRWDGRSGLLVADELGLADGALVHVKAGKVTQEVGNGD
jgi:hypothetical protein